MKVGYEMHDMAAHEVPVLIVGAGPAGLVTAIQLARNGVRSLLVEQRPGLSPLPRATAISTRTMEVLRSWGLEAEVRAVAMAVEPMGWVASTLAATEGERLPLGFPSRAEAAAVSPTAPAWASQDRLEPILLRHLRRDPAVEVRFGTRLLALDQDPDGVTALLRDEASGATQVIRSAFLVGADGAHSSVRARLGIPMRGPDQLVEHLTVLFHAPLHEVVGERRFGIYVITNPRAPGIFVPLGPPDRWLFGQEWRPGPQRLADYPESRLVELIKNATGADVEPRIERVGEFSFAAQVADRFRDGNAFLVGDAAHRVTPRGGTGMNTAIYDGYDLGWKLGWVLRGWAAPELLDTYQGERRPVAVRNTARSADPDGSRRDVSQALPDDLGARVPHVRLQRAGKRRSTLDLVGPGLTLLTGPADVAWVSATAATAATVTARLPVTLCALDQVAADGVGIGRDGAMLLRPDGHVAAAWPSAPADPVAALAEPVRRTLGAPVLVPAAVAAR